jgi:hypothetical protein
MRPDDRWVGGPDQPVYGGGGGPFEENIDIEVGLATVAAIVEVYGRVVAIRSWSRLIMDNNPLKHIVSSYSDTNTSRLSQRRERTFSCRGRPVLP